MTNRESTGLLAWVKRRVLSRSEARSEGEKGRPKMTRSLWVEPLEQRALLSVTMSDATATWKDFEFVGAGNFSGSFQAVYGMIPYTGKAAGPVTVNGNIQYHSNVYGTGGATATGTLNITAGRQSLGTFDIVPPPPGDSDTGTIVDNNGVLAITVPVQDSDDLVLNGTFKTKDFSVTATGSLSVDGNQGTGTWKGKILPVSTDPLVPLDPFKVNVDRVKWLSEPFGAVEVDVSVAGPVQKVKSPTTAVATVDLAWGTAWETDLGTAFKSIKKLSDKLPILWNEASATYTIANLPTPPVGATHLLLVAKIGRTTTLLNKLPLADLTPLPVLQITAPAPVPEPLRGTANAVFTVSLVGNSLAPVTVKYMTVADKATAGADFTAVSKTLTFKPGGLPQTITVKIKSDKLLDEGEEQFFLQFSQATFATLSPDSGKVAGIITTAPQPGPT